MRLLIARVRRGARGGPRAGGGEPDGDARPPELDRGRDSFRAGDWQSAIEVINLLLYPELQLARPERGRRGAHPARRRLLRDRQPRACARREFDARAPDRAASSSIDTLLFSEGAIRLFDETKADIKTRTEREARAAPARRASASAIAGLHEEPRSSTRRTRTTSTSSRSAPASSRTGSAARASLFAAAQGVTGGDLASASSSTSSTKYGLRRRRCRSTSGRTRAPPAADRDRHRHRVLRLLRVGRRSTRIAHYKPRRAVEGDDSLLPARELRDGKPRRRSRRPRSAIACTSLRCSRRTAARASASRWEID